MRLGFDVTPLLVPRSGVGTYALNLYRQLVAPAPVAWQAPALEVIPLAHRPWTGPAEVEHLAGHGRPSRALNKTLWMQAVLPWQLMRMGVHVCHLTNNVAPLWTPCPVVLTIHDMTLWLYPQHHYAKRLLAMRPFIPLAARRAAAIIAVSHSAKRDIVRILGVPAHKVHVVHEAAADCFRPLPAGPALDTVRSRYGLADHFLLYVGTIEPRKNLVRLLEAYAQLRRRNVVSHHLVLVGQRGWKDGDVFAAIERLGLTRAVRFLQQIPTDHLVALYNLADALVFPSWYEGFGLPVVEAMACGTPVVASSGGSLAEVAGNAAEFIDPTASESIAEGIRHVLCDRGRREELRQRGLDRSRRFTWTAAAAATYRVYRRATLRPRQILNCG